MTLRDRRRGREMALQALYQSEITGNLSVERNPELVLPDEASPAAKSFGLRLVRGVLAEREKVDALIRQASEHWRLERLSRIDRNVIRVAVWELMTPPHLAVEIAINEAIELARRFGSGSSAAFVNGVLDEVATQLGLKTRGDGKGIGPTD